jgi:ketosteroid isomerase-like protein
VSETQRHIEAILRAKAAALVARSADAMAALLDRDFVYVNAGGRRVDAAGYLAAFTGDGPLRFQSQDISDLQVTEHEGFAIATMTLHDVFDTPQGHFDGHLRSMAVFRRTPQGWRWSGGQTMRLPNVP